MEIIHIIVIPQSKMTSMKTLFSRPRVDSYYFLINPGRQVSKLTRDLKGEFEHQFGKSRTQYLDSPAHISLMQFLMEQEFERKLISDVEQMILGMEPLLIDIPEITTWTNVVSLKVESKGLLKYYSRLRQLLLLNYWIPKSAIPKRLNPHITIVKSENQSLVRKARNFFVKFQVYAQSSVPEIVLLKRMPITAEMLRNKNLPIWKTVHTFRLKRPSSQMKVYV